MSTPQEWAQVLAQALGVLGFIGTLFLGLLVVGSANPVLLPIIGPGAVGSLGLACWGGLE